MSVVESMTPARRSKTLGGPRIFFLDLGAGRILSANPDGSDLKVIIAGGRKHPDGLAVDAARGHLYWTNMGNPTANDGTIHRSDLDGENITVIVQPGGTFTPKQIQIEPKSQKLYWCDREGMRVMRANLDGSKVEKSPGRHEPRGSTPRTDLPDARKWCVGIAVDTEGGKFYWTRVVLDNAGVGRISRANVEIPAGQGPANRTDIELLYEKKPGPDRSGPRPRPIGPSIGPHRGDSPRGNTVNRAPMDPLSR